LTEVQLNELLPVTGTVYLDEWIELHNTGVITVDLGGWFLADGTGGGLPYQIPVGTLLPPGGFAVFYGQTTGLVLDDISDQVRLFDPDTVLVDLVTFSLLLPDTSYSRDESGSWHPDWPPSPGAPNLPPPTPTPTATATGGP
jgi:hypothetical protein